MTFASVGVTRWVVLVGLSLATAVMFAVSLRSNYLYGFGLGQTEEKRLLFAWANVAADVWKAFGLLAVRQLCRHRMWGTAVVSSFAWLLCLTFGINSALGIYVNDRTATTGTREATRATLRDVEQELLETGARLRELATHRSLAQADAAIAEVLGQPVVVGQRVRGTVAAISNDCTKIDALTASPCAEFARLRTERATASEAASLAVRVRDLRGELRTLRDRGGDLPADPVAEFYAWMTSGWLSVRSVGFGFPLLFAILIEAVSAFGPVTIAAYGEASRVEPRHARSRSVVLEPDMASLGTARLGSVVAWMAERTAPSDLAGAIDLATLHTDYTIWCRATGAQSSPRPAFEREFDSVRALPDIAGKIRKFGDRYFGISIVDEARQCHG